jgi:delta 1-pyrroline-5-carboxylate dehydrogenase
MNKKIRVLIVGDDIDEKVAALIKGVLKEKGIGAEIVMAASAVPGVYLDKLSDIGLAPERIPEKIPDRASKKKKSFVKKCNSKKVKKERIKG